MAHVITESIHGLCDVSAWRLFLQAKPKPSGHRFGSLTNIMAGYITEPVLVLLDGLLLDKFS